MNSINRCKNKFWGCTKSNFEDGGRKKLKRKYFSLRKFETWRETAENNANKKEYQINVKISDWEFMDIHFPQQLKFLKWTLPSLHRNKTIPHFEIPSICQFPQYLNDQTPNHLHWSSQKPAVSSQNSAIILFWFYAFTNWYIESFHLNDG
jgi:hypothetical protein